MFRGSSVLNLDAKGRFAIPTRYRDKLAELCDNVLVLTVSPIDRCLFLYPLPAWNVIDERLEALSDFDRQAGLVKRAMRGSAIDCELDSQGRILIPDHHKQYAGLDKRIVYCGQGRRFELWNEEVWMEQIAACQAMNKVSPSEAVQSLAL